ncbi:MAG: hypothetical protein FWC79_06315 [Oscillospiraceae bacterium]|nr:hypothetical protein [Oscillospiraceae bacterium]
MASPIISTFLTGMPVAFPMMPIMIFELGTYGLVAGLLTKYTKLKMLPKLILTMLAGRIAYAITFTAIYSFFTPVIQVNNVVNAVIVGIPGIAIQIILIPILFRYFKRKKEQDA